jgi:hypothetical protein
LVPVEADDDGSSAAYRQLWQRKLLVTSGEVARFVHLPALKGVETTMSIYRIRGKQKTGGYQITTTQAQKWLWQSLRPSTKGHADPWEIRVIRLDAPLPASTALAIQQVWLAMLRRTQPSNANAVEIDSDRLIFSATNPKGRVQQGRANSLQGNTGALVDLAGRLLQYADAFPSQRPAIAPQIEKSAADLLKQISLQK